MSQYNSISNTYMPDVAPELQEDDFSTSQRSIHIEYGKVDTGDNMNTDVYIESMSNLQDAMNPTLTKSERMKYLYTIERSIWRSHKHVEHGLLSALFDSLLELKNHRSSTVRAWVCSII